MSNRETASEEEAHPHTSIIGPQLRSLTVVEQCIVRHHEHLVSLPEPVPSPKVFSVDIHCSPIRLYCSIGVLHLEILVANQCPGLQAVGVEVERTLEVDDRL